MKMGLTLLSILFSGFANAGIFQCVDALGKKTFSDKKCSADTQQSSIYQQEINIAPFDDKVTLPEAKLKVLYTGKMVGRKSRFLRVSIYEETDTYMIFFVEAYYNGPSEGRGEFRVMPNISWGARSFSTSDQGVSSGYARVGLGSTAKDKDVSDIITLQLWYYSPDNKASVVETHIVPYKKTWSKSM